MKNNKSTFYYLLLFISMTTSSLWANGFSLEITNERIWLYWVFLGWLGVVLISAIIKRKYYYPILFILIFILFPFIIPNFDGSNPGIFIMLLWIFSIGWLFSFRVFNLIQGIEKKKTLDFKINGITLLIITLIRLTIDPLTNYSKYYYKWHLSMNTYIISLFLGTISLFIAFYTLSRLIKEYEIIRKKNSKLLFQQSILIVLFLFIIFPLIIYPAFAPRVYDGSKGVRVHRNMRSIATTLEGYFNDYGCYPEYVVGGEQSIFHLSPEWKQIYNTLPAFKLIDKKGTFSLTPYFNNTSPIFGDPFSMEGTPFAYYSINKKDASGKIFSGWILWSPGPNDKYDLTYKNITKVYTIDESQPSPLLLQFAYDPTNGTIIGGDIFRVKQ